MASRPTEQTAPENLPRDTLVDAHTKPAVDAGSIPAASTSRKPCKLQGFLLPENSVSGSIPIGRREISPFAGSSRRWFFTDLVTHVWVAAEG